MRTVGSLFSGVGGFDLGFEQAGFTIAWQVESDEKARKVLRHRWPDVPIYDDVRTVGAHNLTPVDVLVGGFPCQDLSVAGKREGLGGARSGLFYELMRIARELRPRWVVLENVPGLLTSHGGRDFHAVLAEMADSGFHDRAYRVLDSRYFGVPQRRRRVFLVGRAGAEFGRAGAVLLEPTGGGRDSAAGRTAGARVARGVAGGADVVGVHANQRGELRTSDLAGSLTATRSGKQFEGVCAFDWQSGGKVWHNNLQVASALSAKLGHHGHSSPRGDGSDNLIAATLNSGGNTGGFRTEPGEHLVAAYTVDDSRGPLAAATTLRASVGRYQAESTYVSATVTAKWAKGSGGPSGSEHQNLVAPTLDTGYSEKGWCDQNIASYAEVMASMTQHGVRRLTPLECERLQGFPDMWTCLCGSATTAACTCPDSPRYKQMGNAVTVPVIRWIAERLRAVAEKGGGAR